MMVRTRWRRTLLVCLGLFLLGHAAMVSVADDALPDLQISELVIGPSASVVRGSLIRVEALLSQTGTPLNGNIRVEISWRRLDKQEPCGTTWETVASDSAGWNATVEAWIDTSELIAGDYEVMVFADPDNWIPEANESNNRLVTALTIRPPQPELHPIRLEAIPAIPLAWGETATFKTEIENSGDLSAGSFHVEFSLLPISCIDPETGERWNIAAVVGQSETGAVGNWSFEPAIGVRSIAEITSGLSADAWIPFAVTQMPGLARDQTVELSGVFGTGEWLRELLTTVVTNGTLDASIMTPLSAEEMDLLENCTTTYAIRVSVSNLVGTAEQDAGNNLLHSAISVEPSTLELPELLPVHVTFDENLPLAWDDNVDVEVVVTNRGGSSAPSVLGATSITISFYYRAQGATAWIPLGIETISQLGAEDDSDTDSVEITIDARPSQLALSPGSYELRVMVDEADLIAERNEDNNEVIVGFSVQGTELHPVTLDLPTEPIHQGDTITVVSLVENTGDRSQHDFTVGFYIDDTRFDTFYYQAIAATEDGLEEGDRARVQGVLDTTDLPPETYAIRVVVDPDNHILEHDEGNNTIQSALVLFPPTQRLAELHITEIEFAPTSPVPAGSSLQISGTIRNDGNISAEQFPIEFELSYSTDGEDWTTPILDTTAFSEPPIEAPFQRTLSVYGLARAEKIVARESFSTVGWPIGLYRLVMRVDPSTESDTRGEIIEMDEQNNEAITTFMIGEPSQPTQGGSQGDGQFLGLPNLVFQDVTVAPSAVVDVGSSVSVGATVVNTGVQPSGSFMITLQWTTPTGASYTLLAERVNSLSPGQSWIIPTATVQASLPMGPHAVIGILDTGNEVAESSESDNELYVAISVGQGEGIQPDLAPIAVRFVPSTSVVEAGQEVLVYTTVQNAGALAAGSFAVEVTIGGVVARETWPGLEPLQTIELVHSLGTPDAGTYEVVIQVDSNAQVVESNESNNTQLESLQVTAVEQDTVERVISDQGAVIALALDSSTGELYAAWQNGSVRATDRYGGDRLVTSAGATITDMVAVFGVQDIAYLGASDGRILAIDLASGNLLVESIPLGSEVTALVMGSSGVVYAATANQLVQFDTALSGIAQINLNGTLVNLAFDAMRGTVYALTTTGLYSFDATLAPQCAVTDFVGVPTTFAIGNSGLYVGTSSGVVRALTFCQSYGSVGSLIVNSWRYPSNGSLGTTITAITIDERDVDPIYAATADGTIHTLDFTGNLMWTYQGNTSAIHSMPAIDNRSGRLFFADDAGSPTILNPDGLAAFSINSQASQGSASRANLIVDEVRRQTESGMRLVRIYYFGTDDGWIYKVESIR
ncbi:CARDB domain-containing protein [Candidatus Bipolaricaulota bacterium]